MLLVRFVLTLLLMVAVAVFAVVVDAWWLVAIALLVLIAVTISVVLMLLRYTSSSEWLGADEEAELATEHLVEHETGLPVRHHWHDRQSREQAADVARHGVVPVPDDWRGPDGAFRVLLVPTEPISAEQLQAALPAVGRDELAVLVVAPALATSARTAAVGGATEAVHHAEDVAHETVAALRAAGIHVAGHIGPTDPAVAISDGLRTYAAERVVVARHREQPMRHREDVPLDAAAQAFGVPLREISLDRVA